MHHNRAALTRLFLLFPVLCLALPLAGTQADARDFEPQERALLARIDAQFSSATTMSGDFVQTGPTGGMAQGRFSLMRPGRIYFTYDPPGDMDIVGDGTSIAVINRKLQTQDIVDLDDTPLRHLLGARIDLASRAGELAMDEDFIAIDISTSDRSAHEKITLIFDARSLELRQWSVTDAQNLQTHIALYNVQYNGDVNPDLFRIDYFLNERTRQRNLQ